MQKNIGLGVVAVAAMLSTGCLLTTFDGDRSQYLSVMDISRQVVAAKAVGSTDKILLVPLGAKTIPPIPVEDPLIAGFWKSGIKVVRLTEVALSATSGPETLASEAAVLAALPKLGQLGITKVVFYRWWSSQMPMLATRQFVTQSRVFVRVVDLPGGQVTWADVVESKYLATNRKEPPEVNQAPQFEDVK